MYVTSEYGQSTSANPAEKTERARVHLRDRRAHPPLGRLARERAQHAGRAVHAEGIDAVREQIQQDAAVAAADLEHAPVGRLRERAVESHVVGRMLRAMSTSYQRAMRS
jgi:hypothetical protein